MPLDHSKIPLYVHKTLTVLTDGGFEGYLVGGCVRDLMLERTPKDWDITTNATPEQIISLFPKTVYENAFGTVAVVHETEEGNYVVEVTPYRTESGYSDNRHPDNVIFSSKIEDDLKRRDFTINAMAYSPLEKKIIDLYNGQEDLSQRLLRTVGDATERFTEDGLRILRAIRFAGELDLTLDANMLSAVFACGKLLQDISWERKRDEFTKIIMTPRAFVGIGMLVKLNLIEHIIPELKEGIGCDQKGEHIYDVFEHLLHALDHAVTKEWPLHIRIAALLHDIGKPRTRRYDATKAGGKGKYTFYGHEVIGARMTKKILERMHYPNELIDSVVKLVRYHMFFSDTETITLSAVRRTIVNIGRDHIWELMQIRECDRAGMKKIEAPYRLRKYHAMIEEALRAPTSVGMLKIDGAQLIALGIAPGPRMGWILHALLDICLEDDTQNNRENLERQVQTLNQLGDAELKELGEKGKEKKEEVEDEALHEIRKKHKV